MSYIRAHPWRVFIVGVALMIAACFSTFYMMLAVGVSDGAGHITATVMLAGSALAAFGALLLVVLSTHAIFADL